MGVTTENLDISPDQSPKSRAGLRIAVTVHAATIFLQPVLAGRYLAGDFDILTLHAINAAVVVLTGLVLVPIAIVVRRRGGPRWLPWLCLGLFVGELLQTAIGYAQLVGLHVPLGVALVAVVLVLLTSVWRRP